jgi:outer membrane protein OmpA-like peptidoglycan-associated protein
VRRLLHGAARAAAGSVVVLAAIPLWLSACAANLNDLRATHSGFEIELQEVAGKGARECAPLAYAKAEAEHVFAAIEFSEGDVLRAQYHMDEARKYLDVAKVASAGCTIQEFKPSRDYRVDPTAGRAGTDVTTGHSQDSDGDGILDADDRCPTKPEDMDNHQDTDGCPDNDNDGDGITDDVDQCIDEPEDLDGYNDDDGCVDADDDGDGIPDVNDICPNAAETFNGLDDGDGCPDEALTRVKMERNQIVLLEPLKFKGATADLEANAYMVLSELSVLMESHADKHIRIEAHTDNALDDAGAKTLTVQQANVVLEYLANQGVNRARMEAVGFGSSMPIDTNRTPEGRAANCRIEIYVIN